MEISKSIRCGEKIDKGLKKNKKKNRKSNMERKDPTDLFRSTDKKEAAVAMDRGTKKNEDAGRGSSR